jgi:hypothetical protein
MSSHSRSKGAFEANAQPPQVVLLIIPQWVMPLIALWCHVYEREPLSRFYVYKSIHASVGHFQ